MPIKQKYIKYANILHGQVIFLGEWVKTAFETVAILHRSVNAGIRQLSAGNRRKHKKKERRNVVPPLPNVF